MCEPPRDPCNIAIGLSRIPLNNICVWQDQWRCVIAAQIEEKPKPNKVGQIGKTENHIGYQNRKPVSIFHENQKPINP